MNYSQNFFKNSGLLKLPGENLHFFTLKNGLKVLIKQVQHSHVAHCGIVINTGSRNDQDLWGIAHGMEHMLFKGTQKRKSFHILNRIDSVGGEVNAYTTKEITALYTSVYDSFFERAVELLFDISYHSTFPEKELTKEKKVIQEEIKLYQDSPDENIFDEFQDQLFKGQALGTNILGTEKSVESIQQKDLINFYNAYYKPENMVFVVASDLPEKKILRIIEKYAYSRSISENTNPYFFKNSEKASKVYIENIEKETEHVQAYIILGGEASRSGSENKLKETLLMNILGGPALNSRLNLGIREKYGFTYHIEAGSTHFSDSGFYHCFAGTDKQYIDRTYELILKELSKLKENKMGSIQMLNSLNQFIGQIMISEENKLSSAMAVGRQWLQNEKLVTIHDLMQQINQFTAADLMETANRLFDQQNIAVLKYLPSANE